MTLFEYIMDKKSGRNGANMDFKRLNEPQNLTNELKEKYYNRGMNIGGVAGIKEGNIYGSARDIGNFAAGYMAGSRGLSWTAARAGFDGYESIERKTFRMEHSVTRTAEWLGWKKGFWTKGFKKCLNLK